MIEIDEISHLVTLETEYSLKEIEAQLAERAFTLSYFVPPANELKLEEALSKKAKNLYLTGEWDDLCVSLQIHSKDQKNLKTFLTPRQAAGPDWKNFILGSGVSLGFIYKATLKVFHKPTHFIYLSVALPHDVASHVLEQELSLLELKPLVFARCGSMQLPKVLKLGKASHILLACWAGSRDYIDAHKRAIEACLEDRYSWKWIEGKSSQIQANKLLHERYPLSPWGGKRKDKKESVNRGLQKKIAEAISHGY